MAQMNNVSAVDMIAQGDEYNAEKVNADICSMDVQSSEKFSMIDEKKAKDAISLMKKQTALRLDGQKLALANKIIDGISMNIGILSDPVVNQRVSENIESAQDVMFLSNATEKQIKIMQHLMRVDSVDGAGTSARLAVAFETENGTSFKGLLEFDGM